MPDKKFGPKIKGNIYRNDYKEGKQPDYVTRGKYAIPVSDEFLRHLVEALRGDGTEARISIGLWENEDKNGHTVLVFRWKPSTLPPKTQRLLLGRKKHLLHLLLLLMKISLSRGHHGEYKA